MTLKEPLNLNRQDPRDYVSPPHINLSPAFFLIGWHQSLVELKILRTLGLDRLPDWKITAPRRRFTPRTRAGKDAMIIEEVERMKAHAAKTGGVVDSMHINGPVPYQVVVG